MSKTSSNRRRVFLMRHGSVTYFDETGKPVLPEHAVPGGARTSMLVDWVSVEVMYP